MLTRLYRETLAIASVEILLIRFAILLLLLGEHGEFPAVISRLTNFTLISMTSLNTL